MNWFFIALIPSLFYSISNYFDTYLIDKHTKKRGVGALVLFSSLFGIIIAAVIAIFQYKVLFTIPSSSIGILIIAGIINVVWVLLYLYALESDETTVVVPLFQTIPVFSFFLAWIILGETLSAKELMGAGIIVFGGVLLAVDIEKTKSGYSFKKKPFFLMIAASFLIGLLEVLFKSVTTIGTYWISNFWNYIGFTLAGLFILFFITSYRRAFISMLKESPKKMLGLNFSNETFNGVGDFAMHLAILLAPIALVQSVNSFQPVFILIIGITLTKLFPKIVKENFSKKHLIHKIVAIVIIVTGSLIIT